MLRSKKLNLYIIYCKSRIQSQLKNITYKCTSTIPVKLDMQICLVFDFNTIIGKKQMKFTGKLLVKNDKFSLNGINIPLRY